MKSSSFIALILIAMSETLDAQERKVAVTIYNDNLGVVKETRKIDLRSGVSEIRITDIASQIDPTSVYIKLNGTVIEQNFQYDLVSVYKILEKYLDKTIQLISEKGELLEGTLLSAQDGKIVLRNRDGGLTMLGGLDKYQINVADLPEGLITKPTLVWKVDARASGRQDAEISYHATGMKWRAEYVAVLNQDDSKLDLKAWVSVENKSGATYKDATLKLVAGEVNRVRDDEIVYARPEKMMRAEAVAPQFEEKPLFEYHAYALQRPTTLANNETKQISLFEAEGVAAKKKFLHKGGKSVSVVVEFENTSANRLGIPLPKGKVRVHKEDRGAIEFIGEDEIEHAPKDETVKLKIGDAFDIVVEEEQTDYKQISKNSSETTWKITFKNRKDEAVTIEAERYLGYNWQIVNASREYEKKNATTIVFRVPVPKGKEVVLTFTVRNSY
ncbi:MAG: DUF4139 domain-containing protein [Chloroherpetonaceae bacterium]|nr:DUF4139 domain-containing protein [Chloroherpetonaceae bacterium]MDW8436765.1 DUF4139 domain-containing protein [Chloroherpetonaceae bacterium]